METGQDSQTKNTGLLKETNLHLIFGVTLMVIMGVSSVTPAFPRMMRELDLTAASLALTITLFTLPGVLLTPVVGIMADRFGRKRILVPALFLFAVAGTACGLTTDYPIFLFFRFIQGIGAAALGVLNMTLIGDLYQGRARATAMGYAASVLSLGLCIYPALGGMLAMSSWSYPFLLPILALPLGIAVIFKLDNPEPETRQTMGEYARAILVLVKRKKTLGLMASGVCFFLIIYGPYVTFMPVFLDRELKAVARTIGLVLAVGPLVSAVVSAQLGRLAKRFSEPRLLATGFLFYIAAVGLVPIVPREIWAISLLSGLAGLAQGLSIPVLQSIMAGMAPPENRGAFMSLHAMLLRGGQTLGPIVAGAIFGWWGLEAVYYSGAAIAIIAVGLVLILVDGPKEPSKNV